MFKKLRADKLLLKVLAVALLSRLLVFACGYYAYNIVPSEERSSSGTLSYVLPAAKKTVDPARIFGGFDVFYYERIVSLGYSPGTDNALHQDWNFMPLHPLLIGIPQALGVHGATVLWGIVCSNLFFIIAMAVFAVWLRKTGKEKLALLAVMLFSFFPGSVYFSAAYTESLFVLLTAILLLVLSKKHWLAAAVTVGLAGIARKQGILLILPLLVELLRTRQNWRTVLPLILISCLPLAGFLLYMQAQTGSWLHVFNAQSLWSSFPVFPFSGLYHLIIRPQMNLLLQGIVWFGALALLWKQRKLLDHGWQAYLLISLLISVSAGEMASVIRYVSALLPLAHLGAVELKDRPVRLALVMAAFAAGLALMTLLFVNGYGFAV